MGNGTTMISRRRVLAAGVALPLVMARKARAQAATIKIGVLNDMSGPYRDLSGPVSVACVRQAIEDFGASGKGLNVQVVVGDHQNKPDVGSSIAREWIDREGMDFICDTANSTVALAVSGVVREKNKVYINSTAATAELTGKQCSPNTIHWTYDTWMLSRSTGGAMVKTGGDTWFFLTANYAFGHALENETANFVRAAGGRVVGQVRHPLNTADFSSLLVQAQGSKAKVIGLANAGGDTINCIKQAAEFGLTSGGTKLAGLLLFLSDIHSLGLKVAQGLVLTETFYWDLNDRTRAFTRRVLPKTGNQPPSMGQAGCYASTQHYLKGVADMGVTEAKKDGAATVARLKAMPTDDDAFGPGRIREDGRKLHPAYLFEVKKPEESKVPWDYYKLLATTPAEEAFRPMAEGGCPLIKS